MGQAAKAAEPEESPEEEAWLESHPKLRGLLVMGKMLLVPIIVGALGTWVEVRTKDNKDRAEAGYGAVAPAVKDLQTQVKMLASQVELLQQLLLHSQPAVATNVTTLPPIGLGNLGTVGHGGGTLHPIQRPAPHMVTAAEDLEKRRKELVDQLHNLKPVIVQSQRRVPDNLDDALKMAK